MMNDQRRKRRRRRKGKMSMVYKAPQCMHARDAYIHCAYIHTYIHT
jgi:hypothetical protein